MGGIAPILCNVSPLESALTEIPVSVDYNGLTEMLSPLESTLMKNRGGGGEAHPDQYSISSASG
jgi:hypothetical protein